MKRSTKFQAAAVLVSVLSLAGSAVAAPVMIEPGDKVQERLQEALILVEEGQTIELSEGVYVFTRSLSLDVDRVTLRGQGMDKTILSFKTQNAGSEGLLVTSDGVVLENFAVEDTVGDAIKVKGADGITIRNVRTEWTDGPKPTNGSYGLYPVESKNVLIDGCIAIGASDAGIYVGQSTNIVVRRCVAKFNVAGIEIENCYDADVYECIAAHNTGGILIFDLPNLPQQGGRNVRVFNNRVLDNDTQNFAPKGNIVGDVPMGTGIMIMANRNVEIFGNTLSGNGTTNLMIVAYSGREGEAVDANYYPYPEGIHVHDNAFGTGGNKPDGKYGTLMALVAGKPLPDIVWDGRMNKEKVGEDGKLPKESWLYIHDNGDADFVNLDVDTYYADPEGAKVFRDLARHKGSLPRLPGVRLPGDS